MPPRGRSAGVRDVSDDASAFGVPAATGQWTRAAAPVAAD